MIHNHDLRLGLNKANPFTIPYEVRLQNTIVCGAKGSGKSRFLLPYFAKEQAEDIHAGATFICSKGDTSWVLYRLFKKYEREIVFLTPSLSKGTEDLINVGYSTGSELSKNVIDYTKAIENNKIVIIDLELSKNGVRGREALIKLLYHLQRSMVENSEETPHFVYFDDAEDYLIYIHDLLFYGAEYGFGSTLFIQSFSLLEVKSRELAYFVNANCTTFMAMSLLSYDDMNYFRQRFGNSLKNSENIFNREIEEMILETNQNGRMVARTCQMNFFPERTMMELEEEANKNRKKKRESVPEVISKRRGQSNRETNLLSDIPKIKKPRKIFLTEDEYFNDEHL